MLRLPLLLQYAFNCIVAFLEHIALHERSSRIDFVILPSEGQKSTVQRDLIRDAHCRVCQHCKLAERADNVSPFNHDPETNHSVTPHLFPPLLYNSSFSTHESCRAPSDGPQEQRASCCLYVLPRYANGATSEIWSVYTSVFLK
jgi:hypothetical protein